MEGYVPSLILGFRFISDHMLFKTRDGSIEDSNGKVIFFSTERFVRDICEGDCCFICGVSPGKAQFNNEHILPEWILRKYGLFSRTLELPNGTTFRYDQYTVPCCKDCNSLMGVAFEERLSALINQDYNAVAKFLKTDPGGSWLIFTWLALIFIKTHLKDKDLRLHRDYRMSGEKIGDAYTWEELHHIHCVARSFYTHCILDPKVHGSLLVWPTKMADYYDPFDYGDLSFARTVLLRLGDVAFVTVLNDSCAAWNMCQPLLAKISGKLSPLQLREVAAHFAFLNLNLKERPSYHSEIDSEQARISAIVPDQVKLEQPSKVSFGTVLYGCCRDILLNTGNANKEEMIAHVKLGQWSFLFDPEGRFIEKSMEPILLRSRSAEAMS